MSAELQNTGGTAIAVPSHAPSAMELIAAVIQDKSLTTDKVEIIERLTALLERQQEQERKERFDGALNRVQAKVGRVAQNGLMDRGPGKGQIPYAKREDVDAMIRPLYLAEGFSVTWDAPMAADGKIRVVGHFSCAGHSRSVEITLAPDSSGGKTGPQATLSAISYVQRRAEMMFFNVLAEGEDQNGADVAARQPITQDQADSIRTRMNDLPQSAPGKLLAVLCRKYGVERPEDIKANELADALKTVTDSEKLAAAKAVKR